MRFLFSLILFFITFASPASGNSCGITDDVIGSVVAIYPASEENEAGGGSGVIISDDGFIVTNFHVLQGCGLTVKCGLAPQQKNRGLRGTIVDAVVVGLDPVGDLALLKIIPPAKNIVAGMKRTRVMTENEIPLDVNDINDAPLSLAFAQLANSDEVRVGDEAWGIGNPFLLSCDDVPSVSRGIISGTHRYQPPSNALWEYTDCLQTDAAINPGNSGGGLFNSAGKLIGINGRCSFEKRGRVSVGIGYAISANQVRNFFADLQSGRILDHATLSATVALAKNGSVVIDALAPRSDLQLQGVARGDEIISLSGYAVDSPNTFKNLLGIFPPTWRIPLEIRTRDGTRKKLRVRLAPLNTENDLGEKTEKLLFAEGEGFDKCSPEMRNALRAGIVNREVQQQQITRILDSWRARNATQENFRGSDELLAALAIIQLLRTRPALDFGEVIYCGKAPIDNLNGETIFADLISVMTENVTTRFYFVDDNLGDELGSNLILVECWDTPHSLPLELSWNAHRVRVTRGNTFCGEFRFAESENSNALSRRLEVSALDSRLRGNDKVGENDEVRENDGVRRNDERLNIIDAAQSRMVKIYGSGGMVGLHGYQTGFFISAHGEILTVWSPALETSPQVVTATGARFFAKVLRVDLVSSLAVIAILAENSRAEKNRDEKNLAQHETEFPFFTIDKTAMPDLGTEVFALSNAFNIAQGAELLTVQRGHISACTRLDMRRGAFASAYRGEVIVVDFTTNNPGAAGGALIDVTSGKLLAILGKELRDARTHTWLNYAIPISEIRAALDRAQPRETFAADSVDSLKATKEWLPSDAETILKKWGLVIVAEVAPRTPPFVEAVRRESHASCAGLQSDDLIVRINGKLTPSRAALYQEILPHDANSPLHLTIERDGTLLEILLEVELK